MTEPIRVLILGVGGNVGQGIIKALRSVGPKYYLIGACLDSDAAGLYLTDEACLSPPAASREFLGWLVHECRSRHVDAVLSGVEPVLDVLAAHQRSIEGETGSRLIVSPPQVLAIGNDKQVTCEWLTANGFDAPESAVADNTDAVQRLVARYGHDLFAKPRCGKGSENVCEIHSADDLRPFLGRSDYVIQQRVGTSDAEYTAATVSDRDGRVTAAIVMHRRLQFGTSVVTEIVDQPLLRDTAIRIAERLQPTGPCNMQFRLHAGRPVCFELNVRFSGTTPIRAHFGFNDVDATLEHFVLGKPMPALPELKSGRAIRYWNEIYPSEVSHHRLLNTACDAD